MVGASWRLARTMLGEVGAKMGPRSTKIAQDGSKIKKNASGSDLGAVLAPSWVQYFFPSRARRPPEAAGMKSVAVAGGGGVAGGG